MASVLETIARVAPSDANVLITGEHGTGKEIVARTIHGLSLRATLPLVVVNTGGLAEGVFESELFGHVKGAFTDARSDRIGRFEIAEGGTIFLDEIGNVPLRQQAKLLRVIESGEIERVGSSHPHCLFPSGSDPPGSSTFDSVRSHTGTLCVLRSGTAPQERGRAQGAG
jgi:transcriptional regulator with GAF, ATPase, and Fis domain